MKRQDFGWSRPRQNSAFWKSGHCFHKRDCLGERRLIWLGALVIGHAPKTCRALLKPPSLPECFLRAVVDPTSDRMSPLDILSFI